MDPTLANPLCAAGDLGKPIPESPHAASVCLPLWEHNVGYEEGDPAVIDKMQCGYPRFFVHPEVKRLFAKCERRFAQPHECCFAFPSVETARRCLEFVRKTTGAQGKIHDYGAGGIHALCVPETAGDAAKEFWQHTGEILSSRQAMAALRGIKAPREGEASAEPTISSRTNDAARQEPRPPRQAKREVRERVARLANARVDDVLLFPNGMAAIYCAHRALANLSAGRKSVQFGFPYVDALKIQEKFGSGVYTFLRGDAAELDQVASLVSGESIMGLFCEFPSNPLLRSPDLGRLDELSCKHAFPLVVDDTLSACINTNLLPACDMLATSLTKFFSGSGDVMGGSLVLNPARPLYERLKTSILAEYEDLLFEEDAIVLERNSRDVVERVQRINATTEDLCDTLRSHPIVERVDYPKYNDVENYRAFLRDGGGFGGLFSLQLRDPAENAPRVYDALRICKGPNLGTNFSICCPYTILAHYHELDFAERCHVSQYLLRVSIGLEDADWLKTRFLEALERAKV